MVVNSRMAKTQEAQANKKGLPPPKKDKDKDSAPKDDKPSSEDSDVSSDSDSESGSDSSDSSDSSGSSMDNVKVTKKDVKGYMKAGASKKQAKDLAAANIASIRRHLSDSAKKSAKKEKKRAKKASKKAKKAKKAKKDKKDK